MPKGNLWAGLQGRSARPVQSGRRVRVSATLGSGEGAAQEGGVGPIWVHAQAFLGLGSRPGAFRALGFPGRRDCLVASPWIAQPRFW